MKKKENEEKNGRGVTVFKCLSQQEFQAAVFVTVLYLGSVIIAQLIHGDNK